MRTIFVVLVLLCACGSSGSSDAPECPEVATWLAVDTELAPVGDNSACGAAVVTWESLASHCRAESTARGFDGQCVYGLVCSEIIGMQLEIVDTHATLFANTCAWEADL